MEKQGQVVIYGKVAVIGGNPCQAHLYIPNHFSNKSRIAKDYLVIYMHKLSSGKAATVFICAEVEALFVTGTSGYIRCTLN